MVRAGVMNGLVIALLAGGLAAGCSTGARGARAVLASSPGEYWIQTELFFGLSKPDGSLVAASDWEVFLEDHIVRRFPDGLTVLEAAGRYLDSQHRTIKEPSRLVILLYAPDRSVVANSNITAIVTEYCAQFDQESVLRVDAVGKSSFPAGKAVGSEMKAGQ